MTTVHSPVANLTITTALPSTNIKLQEQSNGLSQIVAIDKPGEAIASIHLDSSIANSDKMSAEIYEGKGGLCLIVTDARKPETSERYFCMPGSTLSLSNTQGQTLLTIDYPANEAAYQAPAPVAAYQQATQAITKQSMILGAGLGTRIEPLTGWTKRSKPALPVDQEHTVISRLAQTLVNQGMPSVLVNTFCEPESVKSSLTNVSGVTLHYIDEPAPSGTAGGLRRVLESPENYPNYLDMSTPILVAQGDAVANVDLSVLIQAHEANNAAISIGCQQVSDDDVHRFGIMVTDQQGADGTSGKIQGFKEKPSLADAGPHRLGSTGFYVLHPKALAVLMDVYKTKQQKTGEAEPELDFAKDVFPAVLAQVTSGELKDDNGTPLCMWAQKLEGYWSDIGNPMQYYQTLCDIQAEALKWTGMTPMATANNAHYWPGVTPNESAKASGAVVIVPAI